MLDEEEAVRCEAFPGPVLDTEIVARTLYSPELFDARGLTPGAFRKVELGDWTKDECGKSSGVSLQRMPPATNEILDKIRAELIGGTDRQPAPHVYAMVGHLRRIGDNETGQILAILADGREGDEGHCVMRTRNPGAIRRLRGDLIALFSMDKPPTSELSAGSPEQDS